MLTFEDQEHVYRWHGNRVPNVTSILQLIEQYRGVPLALLEAARDFGRNVHLACHLFNLGVLDEETLDPALVPYLGGWKQFLHDTGFKVRISERSMYHQLYGFAGTPDDEGEMKRSDWVLDIKSGAVPTTVGYQTAAYKELVHSSEGRMVRGRICLQLTGNYEYKIHEQKDAGDWPRFLTCLNFWKILNERGQQDAERNAA